MRWILPLSSALVLALPVAAEQIDIPNESGFSGYLGVGVNYTDYSSNLVVGTKLKDFGEETIDDLQGSPSSNDEIYAVPRIDLRYTFADIQGQIFLGSQLEDVVRFDFTQRLGYRQRVGGWGVLSGAVVFTNFPQEVWEDPYQVGTKRSDTEREARGIQLGWYEALGSNFNFILTAREIDVDDDRSGAQAVDDGLINADEQRLLRRDGDVTKFALQYVWEIDARQTLTPEITVTERDMDGDAVAGDGFGLQLNYGYETDAYGAFLNGYYGERDFDRANPIFDRKTDAEEYGVNLFLFAYEVFGWDNWDGLMSLTYADSDSDVDFHDMDAAQVGFAVLYNF